MRPRIDVDDDRPLPPLPPLPLLENKLACARLQLEQVFEAAEADLEAAARAAVAASLAAAEQRAAFSALRSEIATFALEGVLPEHCQVGVPALR